MTESGEESNCLEKRKRDLDSSGPLGSRATEIYLFGNSRLKLAIGLKSLWNLMRD